MTTTKTLLALALSMALSLPVLAGPGNGNGNGPPDRTNPDGTRPGNGNGNGGDRGGPPATPPGLGGNPPPGHGGPNPGNGNGDRDDRPGVGRGGSRRVCDGDEEVVGPLGQSGNSHVAHVAFSPADEESDSESWARMMYFWIGTTFDFNVNAHQLEPGSEWTLVARADDGSAICLADGTANPGGELHLRDSIELDSHLPDGLDPFEPTPEGEDPDGTSLELVPTDSADCEAGTVADDAEDVLVSDEDIRFVDVDEVTCPE